MGLWSILEDEISAKRPWTMPHIELKRSMIQFFEYGYDGYWKQLAEAGTD
jgi:hypothetical protein